MKLTPIFEAGTGFRVIDTTERSQPGLLTLEAGEATGEKPSRHEETDQTLIVLEGKLTAEVGRRGPRSGPDAASFHQHRQGAHDDFRCVCASWR